MMIKVTPAAITAIKKEVKDIIDEGKIPLIRLAMSIG
jgi:hypothetical protein